MSNDCGSITQDGAAVCIPGQCSCSSGVKSNQPISLPYPLIDKNNIQEKTMWNKIRSGVAFVIACIASPCCTPIIVPLGLALLAGTPLAVWASANLGWVYGGLTLISIVSFVFAYRWMNQKAVSKRSNKSTQTLNETN